MADLNLSASEGTTEPTTTSKGKNQPKIDVQSLFDLLSTQTSASSKAQLNSEPGQDKDDPQLGLEDVSSLLKQLTEAEEVADGVEAKLDGVLSQLDVLLGALEAKAGADIDAKAPKA